MLKALARRARTISYRALTPLDRIVHGDDPLLPPPHLRLYYYRTLRRGAYANACASARQELLSRGLRAEDRVLDIGSGIGNLAVGLGGFLSGTYDGIDINAEAVAWCQRAITRRYPSFRFHVADLASRAYNPTGRQTAAGYRFPFADQQFDFIFLGSVFTHMLPDAVAQYVAEIARLLAPGGACVESYFLLDGDRRAAIAAGRSFMSFSVEHASGLCLTHRADIPEAAVAIEESFVFRAHEKAGLRIADVRRGKWWAGEADDQDVLTAASIATT